MRIFENANFNFIGNRRKAYIVSGILLLLSVGSLIVRGLELGIDFQGGMEFVVESPVELEPVAVRGQLATALGSEPEVKTFGAGQVLIRTSAEGDISDIQNRIVEGITEGFAGSDPEVVKTDVVGPRFAEDLKQGAIWAVLGSLLVIFVYILLRFEWRFGVGAVAALFHDVTITLGIFSAAAGILPFSLQIDQAIIAAFLTIVGYSLNDTVVVFDRIREYSNLFKTETYDKLVNRSINNTLSRTIVTSGTTLLVVAVLFIFGGEVLRGFAFGLILGVTIGTYSSVFVASPVVVELRTRMKGGRR
ncbi:MAG: protein translocase subunit SecF [Bacteroidetes bacterium SB0662_bin_6]|nr:protein translocase subunit SecF [Bacteroidetes bacterium SB0668_bin_1]MYE03810.1 protein translocase subunit SecF [Bacteroidetes bacterium SB0662_bin_6]